MIIAPVILVASNLSTSKTEITKFNNKEIKMVEALTKFGAVVVAVARIFVPNNSAAVLINTAQKPVAKPINVTIE